MGRNPHASHSLSHWTLVPAVRASNEGLEVLGGHPDIEAAPLCGNCYLSPNICAPMAPTGYTNLSPVVVSSQHAHGRCIIGQDRHLDYLEFVPLGRRKKVLLGEVVGVVGRTCWSDTPGSGPGSALPGVCSVLGKPGTSFYCFLLCEVGIIKIPMNSRDDGCKAPSTVPGTWELSFPSMPTWVPMLRRATGRVTREVL